MKYNFDPFFVDYTNNDCHLIQDFRSECIYAARKAVIYNTSPVVVMMSGGIDSQLVAESLLLASIPFKVIIGRLQIETVILNSHDYIFAENWCLRNNIDILYCDIDVFGEAHILTKYALEASGFSPQYACHMYIMKWCNDNGLFFIAGNGEMDIVLKDDVYYMMDEQREHTLGNFCKIYNLYGVWQFWKQNSRLISAFIELPTVKKLMDRKVARILDYKHECFADVFDFEPRKKYTGFENIQDWDASLRIPMKKIMGKYDDKYYTPLSRFKKRIYE